MALSIRRMPVAVVHDVVIGDIEAPGPRDPAELAVEQEEADEAEPEDRIE